MDIAQGKPCPLCAGPLSAQVLPDVSGDEAPLRLTLRGLPVFACPAPHRYFVGQKFPIWLLNALLDGELAEVPAGTEKGLLFRKFACGGCGARMKRNPQRAETGESPVIPTAVDGGKVAYFVDPFNHLIGLQERSPDSSRPEDIVADRRWADKSVVIP